MNTTAAPSSPSLSDPAERTETIRVLGLDPGLSGGLAVYATDGAIVLCDLPSSGDGASRRINAVAVRDWLNDHHKIDHCFIERASAMPRQGLASTFRYARAVGVLEGVIACCGIPITLVVPTVWKRHFSLIGSDKEASRALAIQRFPAAAARLALKKHHGLAEALLIAGFGLATLNKQG